MEKSLAKDPPARYQKSGDILDDLEALAHGNPTTLQIHPHLPNTNTDEVQTFEFEWDLQSSPGVLWPHVVNTDRLNQAMGLPPAQFRVERDPELGNRRFAETKIMGLKIAWEEHPFEWIEGRRMGVLRQFSHGPFLWFCSIVEMQPLGAGGTKLRHIVHLEPRNVMGRWIGKREAGTKAQKSLNRIYRQIDDYEAAAQKSNPAADPFGKVHEATARQRTAIAARMSRLRAQALSPDILDTLEQFLGHASDQELARIRPGAFADRFGLDLNDVLEVCFQAVQQGLLVLLWDVMCPTCRIPSDVKETLQSLGEHGNCEACNIDFELDFGNSVELIFRAHSEVRPVEIRTYCIGGPAFSAHVVAQIRVAPQERFVCELQLAAGAYKLRGPQLPYAIDFRVNSQGELSRWEVDLCGHPEADDIELKTGAQTVILRNDGDVELLIRIERIASKQDAVTAADASAVSLFRELFPDQILSPGQMVSVETITMLMVELMSADKLYQELGDSAAFTKIHQALRFFDDTIRRYHGAVVKSIGEGITAVFPRAVDAAAAAVALVEKRHEALPAGSDLPRAAIHRGTAMVTTIDDRLDYFGSTVKITEQLLRAARAGQIVCSGEVAGSAELDQVLRAQATRAMLVDREPLFEYPRVFPHRWTLT